MRKNLTPRHAPMKWNCHLLGFWTAMRDGEYKPKDFPDVHRSVVMAIKEHNKRTKRFQVPQDLLDRFQASSTQKKFSNTIQSLYDWAEARKVLIK